MFKVKLLDNLRYFDSDDSDFDIKAGEIKELPERYMKSYSIKLFLFSGRLQAMAGEVLFSYKSSLIHLSTKGLYGKENNRYFKKDFGFNSIDFIQTKDVPTDVYAKLNEGQEKIVVSEPKEVINLNRLTRKELTDIAYKKNITLKENLTVNKMRDEIKVALNIF